MFIFKLILAIFGGKATKALGHHPGSGFLIGLLFGHFLDILLQRKVLEWKYKGLYQKKAKEKAEYDFRLSFYTLAGKICLADGPITDRELKKIEEISIERLKVKKRDFKHLKKIFIASGSSPIPIQSLGIRLVELFQGDQSSLKNLMTAYKELAEVDGPVNDREYKALFTLGVILGNTPEEINKVLGNAKESIDNSKTLNVVKTILDQKLEILGCQAKDSNDIIKRRYREMVAKFHPDKVSAKDLPQDFIEFAEKKFNEIKLAYDFIRKERKF